MDIENTTEQTLAESEEYPKPVVDPDPEPNRDPMRCQPRKLTSDEHERLGQLKVWGNDFYALLDKFGQSRELSLAKTNLEQAIMWASKGLTS